MDIYKLNKIAVEIRAKIIEISNKRKVAHLGSSLSCVDLLVSLYWECMNVNPENVNSPERDRFILSKGHAAVALYTTLAFKGFFPIRDLDDIATKNSKMGEHPAPYSVSGVEIATGSLGHGLPFGVGMALASKITKNQYKVFVILSDGECNEGSTWEAAMFSSAKKSSVSFVMLSERVPILKPTTFSKESAFS